MFRIVFRVLLAATLIGMFYARLSGLPPGLVPLFYYWFLISVGVFGVFGIYAAVKAVGEPVNRRAYLFDVMLAAIWVPYWFANLR